MKLGRNRLSGRRRLTFVLLLTLILCFAFLTGVRWVAKASSSALLPPLPFKDDLDHLRRERNLKAYVDATQILVEPSSSPCQGQDSIPLIVMVASSPGNLERRDAIRNTWGKRLTTFFVMGVETDHMEDQLVELFIEAKEYSDMIVFDFTDRYMNMTLKSALMLTWSLKRCPQAQALLKTDDDMFLNPWMMMEVVKEHANHQLCGYKKSFRKVNRDMYSKWYLPRWLYPSETIPEYLGGLGYLINGKYIEKIVTAAYKVPMINLEDVYFTYKVAKERLGLVLTHERRLSPLKPWVPTACALWGFAASHSYSPGQMLTAWESVEPLGLDYENGGKPCRLLRWLSSDWFLRVEL